MPSVGRHDGQYTRAEQSRPESPFGRSQTLKSQRLRQPLQSQPSWRHIRRDSGQRRREPGDFTFKILEG